MEIEVLFYGMVSEAACKSSIKYQNVKDTDELSEQLTALFPQLQNMTYIMALNQEILKENTSINNGDVIAILPPFAGG